MKLSTNLFTKSVDKYLKLFILCIGGMLVSACASSPKGFCPEHHYTAPYYQYDTSLRTSPHAPPNAHHHPPHDAGTPGRGDVVFARQNRYPVRVDYTKLGPRDLGAAYEIGTDVHVLRRRTPSQIINHWESNPTGSPEHYRDPECFNPTINLRPGDVDKCGGIRLDPRQAAIDSELMERVRKEQAEADLQAKKNDAAKQEYIADLMKRRPYNPGVLPGAEKPSSTEPSDEVRTPEPALPLCARGERAETHPCRYPKGS